MKNNKLEYLTTSRHYAFKGSDFPLNVISVNHLPSNLYHAHEGFCELMVMLRGTGMHLINGEVFPLSMGDVSFVAANQVHAYRNLSDVHYVDIIWDPNLLKFPLYDIEECRGYHILFDRSEKGYNNRLHLPQIHLKILKNLINNIQSILENKEKGYQLHAVGIFIEIIAFLSQSYDSTKDNQILQEKTFLSHGISRLTKYLEKNFDRQVSISQMCKHSRMSRTLLFQEFKSLFKMSPTQYLIELRIANAFKLLISNKSISEIAMECGFQDANYFTRQFRMRAGVSPREYRNRYASTSLKNR
jgi:AraC-like DNA-binding protein/mannose-6-phosphate isomerase-like protein (cupin superfamily)